MYSLNFEISKYFTSYSFKSDRKANKPWMSLFWLYNVDALIIDGLRGLISITVKIKYIQSVGKLKVHQFKIQF